MPFINWSFAAMARTLSTPTVVAISTRSRDCGTCMSATDGPSSPMDLSKAIPWSSVGSSASRRVSLFDYPRRLDRVVGWRFCRST